MIFFFFSSSTCLNFLFFYSHKIPQWGKSFSLKWKEEEKAEKYKRNFMHFAYCHNFQSQTYVDSNFFFFFFFVTVCHSFLFSQGKKKKRTITISIFSFSNFKLREFFRMTTTMRRRRNNFHCVIKLFSSLFQLWNSRYKVIFWQCEVEGQFQWHWECSSLFAQ